MFRAISVVLFLLCFLSAKSTDKDTTRKEYPHSPRKAVILSAVLPGAGQVYNRKYWKVPVIYAGLGVSTYFIIDNSRLYKQHRSEYLYRLNNNGAISDQSLSLFSTDQLRTLADQYQRWRDYSIVATAVVYTLNLVDAAVDAHLWRFDVGEDLSLGIRPSFQSLGTGGICSGFRLTLKL